MIKLKTIGKFNVAYIEGKLPLVKFYDIRYPHTEFGQFVSSYYASTLLKDHGDYALCLDGGVDEWSLTYDETKAMKAFVSECYAND